MKKYIFIFLTICTSLYNVYAQDVKVYFEIIPEQHLLQIDANRRKDLIDMKLAGQEAIVPNRLGGTSVMTDLTNDYIRIQTSSAASFEMRLLSDSIKGQMIVVINTTCASICDSDISFYSTTWQPIEKTKHFQSPQIKDFLKKDFLAQSKQYEQTLNQIDMSLIELNFSNNSTNLIATLHYKDYLPENIVKDLEPILNDSIECIIQ